MIYSRKLLVHPKVKLPAIPPIFSWDINTSPSGEAFLVLKTKDGVYASQKLPQPSSFDEDFYAGVVSRAAMSLRWDLNTQFELEAEHDRASANK